MIASNDKPGNQLINEFKREFEGKRKECAVLIVRAVSDLEKWTVAGFSDREEFRTTVIDDSSPELLRELKKEPRDKTRITELALSSLGRTHLQVCDLVDWIADWGGDADWVPLLSVARQLHERANEPTRSCLAQWINRAAQHFGVTEVWEQPRIVEEKSPDNASQSPVLLVEMKERDNSESAHQVRFFYHIAGRRIEAKSNADASQFTPSSAAAESAIARHIKHLMYEFLIDQHKVMVAFILPNELLRYPVEQWFDDRRFGDPQYHLGAEFPVVVRPSLRQYRKEFDPLRQDWQSGWKKQLEYRDRSLSQTLCWVKATEKKRLLTRPKQGYVCIGLCLTITDPEFFDCFDFLVEQGITAAIWPRCCDNVDNFCEEIEQKLGDARLKELPKAVHSMRRALWGEDKTNHPCYHLSLLWDDPDCCLPSQYPEREEDYLSGLDY